ncbi:4766_t:CDS:2, partial [Diversispora eburnea]
ITTISNIADIGIIIFANDDTQLTKYIINVLQRKGAQNIRICYPENSIQHADLDIGIKKVPINWNNFEWSIENAIVVVSMLYNDFDKQETLLNACIRQEVALFISWDSGMELTRLHKRLIDYQAMKNNNPESMNWILFQVGIFDEEILKNDISTITTAFNSPSQYIFLNVTVKEDLAMLVAETITSEKVLPNRNYVIGDFVAHTFLQHAYQVANNGMQLDSNMPADISEFETTNQLRLSGIVSARPLPRILYPG